MVEGGTVEPPRHRFDELLTVLPRAQREILTLRVVRGLSAEETARMLGMTPGAVRLAQHKALNRLRAMLDEPRRGA